MPKEFNDVWLYVGVLIIILAALLQMYIFVKKAWHRALGLGYTNHQIKQAFMTGVSISIVPTVPVLLVFLSLSQILGGPVPWLRLSVVGSAHYEAWAASLGVQALGEELLPGAISIKGWIAASWVMMCGGSLSVLWSSCMFKPISLMYQTIERKYDMKMVLALGTGCMFGVMSYMSVTNGLSAVSTKGVVFGISFVCGALLVWLRKKNPSKKWITDCLMGISMFVAMVAACFIF
ncbi:MAG: DUF5058 family protein [bacterium]|nr:DUF5058 family protein [bacterium]